MKIKFDSLEEVRDFAISTGLAVPPQLSEVSLDATEKLVKNVKEAPLSVIMPDPDPDPEPEKPAPKKPAPDPEPAPEEVPFTEDAKTYTKEEVKAELFKVRDTISRDAMKEILNKYASKLSLVKEEDYPAVVADCKEALNA